MAVDGRVVLGVLAAPLIWSSFKSAYWSVQFRKLNDREVLSDRYSTHSLVYFRNIDFLGCTNAC